MIIYLYLCLFIYKLIYSDQIINHWTMEAMKALQQKAELNLRKKQ